jgi:hypothetical protein
MIVEMTYDAEQNEYCIFRGCDMILNTPSFALGIRKFNELCDQVRSIR